MEKVISNDRADIFFLAESRAMVSLSDPRPKSPIELIPIRIGNVAAWGNDNLFPQRVNKDVRKTTELASGLRWMTNTLISGGLVYGTLEYGPDGEEILKPVRDPDVEKWLRNTNVNRYLRENTYEFNKFWNAFPRLTMSRDGSMVNEICAMESMFTRLGIQDQVTGELKTAYINANWEMAAAGGPLTLTYPLIDPYYDAINKTRASNSRQFIYPISGVDSGNIYYQVAPWNSVRESGWLEVAQLIPSFKKNLLKNQYTIKYHFQLSSSYWSWRFPKWESMNETEKVTAKKSVMGELDMFLKGEENAGRNIMSIAENDPVTKKLYPGLEIIAIDDKIKSGIYIEDSQEASLHIFNALGIDGTLIGSIPGNKIGGGSGSDKRVAYNIYITGCKAEQDLMLEPINFCFEYNGFNKKYEAQGGLVTWFKNYWVAKLDEGKETQQQAS